MSQLLRLDLIKNQNLSFLQNFVKIGMIVSTKLVFSIWLFLMEKCSGGNLLPDLVEEHMDPKTAVTEE